MFWPGTQKLVLPHILVWFLVWACNVLAMDPKVSLTSHLSLVLGVGLQCHGQGHKGLVLPHILVWFLVWGSVMSWPVVTWLKSGSPDKWITKIFYRHLAMCVSVFQMCDQRIWQYFMLEWAWTHAFVKGSKSNMWQEWVWFVLADISKVESRKKAKKFSYSDAFMTI